MEREWVSERDECGGCCIYEKDGLFLIWWGPTPAKNSERHANRKTERDKEWSVMQDKKTSEKETGWDNDS